MGRKLRKYGSEPLMIKSIKSLLFGSILENLVTYSLKRKSPSQLSQLCLSLFDQVTPQFFMFHVLFAHSS